MAKITDIKSQSLQEVNQTQTVAELEEFRLKYFGKKGLVTSMLKGMGSLSPEERQVQGPAINALKTELLEAVESKLSLIHI